MALFARWTCDGMTAFSDIAGELAQNTDNMRRALATAALFLLCACASGASEDVEAAPATVSARFVAGGLSNVIVVSVVDRLPLRQAVLVSPDGERVPAYAIDVDADPRLALVPGEELLLATPGTPRYSISARTMASTALIQLPDPVQYAKAWRNSRIEVTLGDPGSGKSEQTLAAPSPPPI